MFSLNDFLNFYTVIGCGFVFLWYLSRSSYSFWSKLNVKYLEPIPFLGNTFKVWLMLAPKHEQLDKFYKALYDEPFGGIYEFRKPQLIMKDPELISATLVKDFKHFHDRGYKLLISSNKELDPLTANLLMFGGERWRVLRQKLTPVFSSGKLKHMQKKIFDCADLLTKYIDMQMDGKDSMDVGLRELFEKLTIDVIGSCAFGFECDSLKSSEKFSRISQEAFKPRLIVGLRMFLAAFSQRLVEWLKIPFMKKTVTDFFMNLTLETIEYRRQNKVMRHDLLQSLMELQNSHVNPKYAVGHQVEKVLKNEEFDEIDIVANAFIFYMAGFETTSSTLSYCFYELALNQNVQDKLRIELQQVKDEGELTYERLAELTYMDAVISETLRKYPPAIDVIRECTKAYIIPGTKIQIPVGTNLIIPVWSIQHDWKYYPNPEMFDPERFLGDNKHSRSSGTFLPFGDGPRHCIGKRFALMEIKATLSEMILKYDIKPCAKTEIPLKFKKGMLLLQTTCGTWVNLSKR